MKPAAISASLVDVRNVAVHKCVRLTVEVPAEMAMAVIEAFGWPTAVDPVSIAIARLTETKERRIPQTDRSETDGNQQPQPEPKPAGARNLAQQAGACCADRRFQRFLIEQYGLECADESIAAAYVRRHCIVASRSDIRPNTPAARLWRELHDEYKAWLMVPV